MFCKIGEDEGDAYEGVASVVCCRVDDAAVAFASDDCIGFFHLCYHIDFAHCCGVVFATVFSCYVAQCACGAEVADGVAGCVLQDVVGHCDECVFFAVHCAVFAEEGEAVYVGVYDEGDVVLAFLHQCFDVGEVLFEWFGVVLEVAGGFGEESGDGLYAELFEQFWQDDSAYAVDAVEGDAEVCLTDGFCVHEVESEHEVDVFLVVGVVFAVGAKAVYVGIFEVFGFGDAEHFVSFLAVEEFAL